MKQKTELAGPHPSASPEIVIVSKFGPTCPGGLGAYQQTLARALSEKAGVSSFFLCKTLSHSTPPLAGGSSHPWPLQEMESLPFACTSRDFWPRLARYPVLHPLLIAGLSRAWKRPENIRPRVVHFVGTGVNLNGFAVVKWARQWGAKLTIWPAVHPRSTGDVPFDLRLYQMADTVFCQSRYEMDHLAARGLNPAKMVLCGLPPMCLKPEQGDGARLRARLGIGERPVVLFLGRRTKGKRHSMLITAWKRVLKSFPEAVLLLAGPLEHGGELLATLPPDSYRDLGPVDECDKADALAACQIVCVPSINESFGIVYVEAWSFGKPVICGTAPASRELIENGKTGLWANSRKDPLALAEPIMILLRSCSLAQCMGEEGRKVQLANYTEERMLETHLKAWT